MSENVTTKLQEWGIETAAREMQWQFLNWAGCDGMVFPLYHLNGDIQERPDNTPIQRWKNFTDGANAKYLWIPDKPDHTLEFYFHPEIAQHIEQADGVLYLVEGEKDLLSMLSAGIPNVITWLNGATSIPHNLVEALKLLGCTNLIHLPDLDEAGRKSSTKTADMLKGQNINYKAICLPATLGEKGDVNDWWQACEFNIEQFQEELTLYSQTAILREQDASFHDVDSSVEDYSSHQADTDSELPQAFIEAVKHALGVDRVNRRGYAEVCCPFHDDTNPSANWDVERHILHCFACGETFLARKVGEHFNIHLRDFYPPTNNNQIIPAENPIPSQDTETVETTTPTVANTQRRSARVPTDDEVGDGLIRRWDEKYRYFYGKWHTYDKGVWESVDVPNKEIWKEMRRHKDSRFRPSKGKASSILSYVESVLSIPNSEVDQGKGVINLQNGMLSLETVSLEPHDEGRYLTSQLPFEFNEEASCPHWLKFLSEVLVDESGEMDAQLIDLLQEAFGYSLTSDTSHEKMVWLHGQAATGKSTILRVLKALLGSAALEIGMNELRHNSYQLAEIGGKRVLTCSEAASGAYLADAHIKKIVSGEEIVARQIYSSPQYIQPIAKLWWAMNEVPQNLDRSDAIYRRLILIPFHRPIPKEERDIHLFDKFVQELPGILNWALEGLKRLNTNGTFTEAAQVEQSVQEYQQDNDAEAEFLSDEEWISEVGQGATLASDLYIAYSMYSQRFGYNAKSRKMVARDWKRLGLIKSRQSAGYIYNLTLTQSAENIVETQRKIGGENRR